MRLWWVFDVGVMVRGDGWGVFDDGCFGKMKFDGRSWKVEQGHGKLLIPIQFQY